MSAPVAASWTQVIRDYVESRLAEVHTALPAEVVSYDAAAQTVDVQPLVKRVFLGENTDEAESLPQIRKVPVAFPRAGDNWITFPIAKGDVVLLVFCERAIDKWRTDGREVDPGDTRRHDLSDAVAIPGVYPSGKKVATSSSAVVINAANELHLGGLNPSEFVALATKVKSELDAIKADLDALKTTLTTHVHVGVTAGGGVTGTSANFAGWTPHTPAAVAASKVKAV